VAGVAPGPLGLTISYQSNPLPIEFAWDLMEVTYCWPPWLTGSYHPRRRRGRARLPARARAAARAARLAGGLPAMFFDTLRDGTILGLGCN
jgi:hypothetical protein